MTGSPSNDEILSHQLANGLTLVAQPMPWLESVAFSLSVPGGYRYDPAHKAGLSNFVCEMVLRGSGSLSSREFVEALEFNGVDYGSSSLIYMTSFAGAMQADRLDDVLAIYADVVQRPHFPGEQLEDGRMVCLAEIQAMEDDLAQRAMLQLRERFYGDPDGRSGEGTLESVGSITMDDIHQFFRQNYRPDETILAVAGKLEWQPLVDRVQELFGDWESRPAPSVDPQPGPAGVHHISFPSEQTHIALAYPAVPYSSDQYFLNRGAVGVLSDGLSSRLFTEIREKRGLCYTVSASGHSLRDRGSVICYSSTTSDRAQETLDVLVQQLQRLAEGISEDELRRLKIQIRSGLVMQQESCRSRARAIAGEWFHLGRVRTMDEITNRVNGLSVQSFNDFLARNPPRDFSLVTLGPEPLELNINAVSATTTG